MAKGGGDSHPSSLPSFKPSRKCNFGSLFLYFSPDSPEALTRCAHENHSGSQGQDLSHGVVDSPTHPINSNTYGYFPSNLKNLVQQLQECMFIPDVNVHQGVPYLRKVPNYLETWPDFCKITLCRSYPATFSFLQTKSSYSVISNTICSPCLWWHS